MAGTALSMALGGVAGVGRLVGSAALSAAVNGVQLVGGVASAADALYEGDLRGALFAGAGVVLGGLGAAGFNPCRTSSQFSQRAFYGAIGVSMVGSLLGMQEKAGRAEDWLDYLDVGVDAAGIIQSARALLAACFARGTHVRTPEGSKLIEELREGDWVLSRHEFDPTGPVIAQRVEEMFVRTGRIWKFIIDGKIIRTTGEHPFYAQGRGWKALAELAVGDKLLGEIGEWLPIEALEDTGTYETVYNFRVSDFHTYFVGCEEWGFSVWAHNANGCGGHDVEDELHARGRVVRDEVNAGGRVVQDELHAGGRVVHDELPQWMTKNQLQPGEVAEVQRVHRVLEALSQGAVESVNSGNRTNWATAKMAEVGEAHPLYAAFRGSAYQHELHALVRAEQQAGRLPNHLVTNRGLEQPNLGMPNNYRNGTNSRGGAVYERPDVRLRLTGGHEAVFDLTSMREATQAGGHGGARYNNRAFVRYSADLVY